MILKRVNWFSFVSQCLINVRGFLFDRQIFLSIFSDTIDIVTQNQRQGNYFCNDEVAGVQVV